MTLTDTARDYWECRRAFGVWWTLTLVLFLLACAARRLTVARLAEPRATR